MLSVISLNLLQRERAHHITVKNKEIRRVASHDFITEPVIGAFVRVYVRACFGGCAVEVT